MSDRRNSSSDNNSICTPPPPPPPPSHNNNNNNNNNNSSSGNNNNSNGGKQTHLNGTVVINGGNYAQQNGLIVPPPSIGGGDGGDGIHPSLIQLTHHSPTTSDTPPPPGYYKNPQDEIKFLKEWLLTHLDLIQQQNEEILSKERQIFMLQQENLMLKDRLKHVDSSSSISPNNNHRYQHFDSSTSMTQQQVPDSDMEITVNPITDQLNNRLSVTRTPTTKPSPSSMNNSDSQTVILENSHNSSSSSSKRSKRSNSNNSDSTVIVNNNRTVYSSDLCCYDDDDSTVIRLHNEKSPNNTSCMEDGNVPVIKHNNGARRFNRKRTRTKQPKASVPVPTTRKSIPKPLETTSESSVANSEFLEVPRWRIKVYASCYSMEGTENLDDEVFHKRHSRLEVNERRRKRWDVQRIREQRVIEKLKQRQDRINNHQLCSTPNSNSDWITSFLTDSVPFLPRWEDIRYIEVSDEIPVMAFGHPIPKLEPSEFSIPWLEETPEYTQITDNLSMLITETPKKSSGYKRKNSSKRL